MDRDAALAVRRSKTDGAEGVALAISSLSLYQRHVAPAYPSIRFSISNILADAAWSAGETAMARTVAERSIKDIESSWGTAHIALAAPLTVLGQAELAAGDTASAIVHLDRALALRADSDPLYRGDTAFALARALSRHGCAVEHSRALARAALAAYTAAGRRRAERRAEVEVWLAAP